MQGISSKNVEGDFWARGILRGWRGCGSEGGDVEVSFPFFGGGK